MAVEWVIARHPDLGAAVMPADAVDAYPGWEADAEIPASADSDALRAALELEALNAARAAQAPAKPAAAKPAPPAKTTAAPAAQTEER